MIKIPQKNTGANAPVFFISLNILFSDRVMNKPP